MNTSELMKKRVESVSFEMTTRCNLFCSYCIRNSGGNNNCDLDKFSYFRAIDDIVESKQDVEVVLTGGEFTIRDDWHDIVSITNKKTIAPAIITNGTLLTREDISFLSDSDIRFLQVSLDGLTKDGNALRKGCNISSILTRLDMLGASKIASKVVMRATITKLNILELPEYIDYASNRGFSIRFGLLTYQGRAADNENICNVGLSVREILATVSKLEKMKQQYPNTDIEVPSFGAFGGCPMIQTDAPFQLSVSAHGSIYPCYELMISGLEIGNIGIDNIMMSMQTQKAKDILGFLNIRAEMMKENECSSCAAGELCRGGCAANGLASDRNIFKLNQTACKAAKLHYVFSKRNMVR